MKKKLNYTDRFQITLKRTFITIIFALLVICPIYVYVYWQLTNINDLFTNMMAIYFISGIGTILFTILSKTLLIMWKWLDHDAIQCRLRLWAYRLNQWYRCRNVKTIYPKLQNFIFYIMCKNKDHIPFPVGNDINCLTPYGKTYTYRYGCVFYRFQLIIPDIPDLPVVHLKRLLQHYITAESRNYGIVGLYHTFEDLHGKIWDSVFIDQILLDEENHILTFDILYVSSEKASKYMILATQRETNIQNNSQEVFDNDIC